MPAIKLAIVYVNELVEYTKPTSSGLTLYYVSKYYAATGAGYEINKLTKNSAVIGTNAL